MKLEIVTGRKGHFESETPEQMVMFLWKVAWLRETTPAKYTKQVSRRVKIYNGKQVRFDTAQHFLEDLEAAGLVAIEWEEV